MTIITIAAAGIATVLLAVQLKGLKGEYAAYMVMAAGAFYLLLRYRKAEGYTGGSGTDSGLYQGQQRVSGDPA